MTRSGNRPEKSAGGRDLVSAWLIVAVLLLALALVPAFDDALSEGLRVIAELH